MSDYKQQTLALPDYPVPERVWQRIEQRIEASKRVSPYWALAAAVVISVALMLPTQTLRNPPYWLELLHQSQQHSQQQLSPVLLAGQAQGEAYLPLLQLQQASDKVMLALARDPDNPKLARMLKHLYQQQWWLMTTLSKLPEHS